MVVGGVRLRLLPVDVFAVALGAGVTCHAWMAYGIAIVYETVVNTMLQTGVPYHMRGRVLSFQGMLWGVTGMTGFHTGAISTFFGAPLAIGVGAVIVMLNAVRLIPRASSIEREADLGSDESEDAASAPAIRSD